MSIYCSFDFTFLFWFCYVIVKCIESRLSLTKHLYLIGQISTSMTSHDNRLSLDISITLCAGCYVICSKRCNIMFRDEFQESRSSKIPAIMMAFLSMMTSFSALWTFIFEFYDHSDKK